MSRFASLETKFDNLKNLLTELNRVNNPLLRQEDRETLREIKIQHLCDFESLVDVVTYGCKGVNNWTDLELIEEHLVSFDSSTPDSEFEYSPELVNIENAVNKAIEEILLEVAEKTLLKGD